MMEMAIKNKVQTEVGLIFKKMENKKIFQKNLSCGTKALFK